MLAKIKKRKAFLNMLLIFPLLFYAFVVPVGATSQLEITINNQGKLGSNNELIFDEMNIGPGFSKDYSINFINKNKESAKVYVEKIVAQSSSSRTDHFRFSFEGDDVVVGGIDDFNTSSKSILLVPANSVGALNLNFLFMSSAGNEYQNSYTKFYVTFRVESDSKDPGNPDEEKPRPDEEKPGEDKPGKDKPSSKPTTGDNNDVWLWVGGMFVSVMGLYIVLVDLKNRKVEENGK